MKNKPKVVFTFVEAGFGHIVPATGVADAFENKYGDLCEVVRLHIFRDSKNKLVQEYGRELANWVKITAKNKLVGFSENLAYLIGSKMSLKVLDIKFKKVKDIVMNELKQINPDLIFNTYYSPAHFALEAREKGMIDPIVATYTPDPVVYPAWDRRSDLYFVNNDSAYKHALKTGFKKENLFQVPFILRKEIKDFSITKKEARKNLEIDENKFTILLASGAYGTKTDKKVVESLLNSNLNINLVVVCGKNQELFDFCNNFKLPKDSKTTFKFVGFTNNMFLYNVSSDLMIGKSGANALVESFYFGVPVLVSSQANLLEKQICNFYIKQEHCGEKLLNLHKLVKRVKEIVDNPKLLDIYKPNLKKYKDFSGAEKIADKLFEVLNKKYNLKKDN